MVEFINDWWTLGLLIAWVIAAEVIAIRDNWWLFQYYMNRGLDESTPDRSLR